MPFTDEELVELEQLLLDTVYSEYDYHTHVMAEGRNLDVS